MLSVFARFWGCELVSSSIVLGVQAVGVAFGVWGLGVLGLSGLGVQLRFRGLSGFRKG